MTKLEMMQILQAQVCGCISAHPGWWRSQPKIFWGPTKYGGQNILF